MTGSGQSGDNGHSDDTFKLLSQIDLLQIPNGQHIKM